MNGTTDLGIGGLPAAYPIPKLSKVLTDYQIADVVTFMRASWNNGALAAQPAEVTKLRKATNE